MHLEVANIDLEKLGQFDVLRVVPGLFNDIQGL
jgi:hypothetical protein